MNDADIHLRISQVFASLNTPWSIDRMIADPVLNEEFIRACNPSGLTESASILNRRLMNLRKRALIHRNERARSTSFSDEDSYRFANEIAGVFLELHVLPANTPTPVRRALETELIRSRRPLFNVLR